MFRYKKSVPVSYERQGYIYFASRLYRELTEEQQHKLLNLCLQCGGEHYHALFEFVTTDAGATAVCMKHFLSRSTLERAVRRYDEDEGIFTWNGRRYNSPEALAEDLDRANLTDAEKATISRRLKASGFNITF